MPDSAINALETRLSHYIVAPAIDSNVAAIRAAFDAAVGNDSNGYAALPIALRFLTAAKGNAVDIVYPFVSFIRDHSDEMAASGIWPYASSALRETLLSVVSEFTLVSDCCGLSYVKDSVVVYDFIYRSDSSRQLTDMYAGFVSSLPFKGPVGCAWYLEIARGCFDPPTHDSLPIGSALRLAILERSKIEWCEAAVLSAGYVDNNASYYNRLSTILSCV